MVICRGTDMAKWSGHLSNGRGGVPDAIRRFLSNIAIGTTHGFGASCVSSAVSSPVLAEWPGEGRNSRRRACLIDYGSRELRGAGPDFRVLDQLGAGRFV